jgi:hypothetical protein
LRIKRQASSRLGAAKPGTAAAIRRLVLGHADKGVISKYAG